MKSSLIILAALTPVEQILFSYLHRKHALAMSQRSNPILITSTLLMATLFLTGCSTKQTVNKPLIQTEGPIIHLADNLDEPDQLGWCIDTEGRDFSDT